MNLTSIPYSPLHAVYEHVTVTEQSLGHAEAIFDNRARFDALITPNEVIGEVEGRRLEQKLNQKFRGAGSGALLVAESNFKVNPMQWSPVDLGVLELYGVTYEMICDAFGVPQALVSKDTNLANLQASRQQHAEQAVMPRLNTADEAINRRLVPLYDDSGRLFVASDNPIKEDRDATLKEMETWLRNGVATRSEARVVGGFEPEDWADIPAMPSNMTLLGPDGKPDIPEQQGDGSNGNDGGPLGDWAGSNGNGPGDGGGANSNGDAAKPAANGEEPKKSMVEDLARIAKAVAAGEITQEAAAWALARDHQMDPAEVARHLTTSEETIDWRAKGDDAALAKLAAIAAGRPDGELPVPFLIDDATPPSTRGAAATLEPVQLRDLRSAAATLPAADVRAALDHPFTMSVAQAPDGTRTITGGLAGFVAAWLRGDDDVLATVTLVKVTDAHGAAHDEIGRFSATSGAAADKPAAKPAAHPAAATSEQLGDLAFLNYADPAAEKHPLNQAASAAEDALNQDYFADPAATSAMAQTAITTAVDRNRAALEHVPPDKAPFLEAWMNRQATVLQKPAGDLAAKATAFEQTQTTLVAHEATKPPDELPDLDPTRPEPEEDAYGTPEEYDAAAEAWQAEQDALFDQASDEHDAAVDAWEAKHEKLDAASERAERKAEDARDKFVDKLTAFNEAFADKVIDLVLPAAKRLKTTDAHGGKHDDLGQFSSTSGSAAAKPDKPDSAGSDKPAATNGDKPGKKPAAGEHRTEEQKPNEKVERAKKSKVLVDKAIQRYAEEYNEPRLAKVLGGESHPDAEPMDITTKNGDLVEVKTIVANTNKKITMDSYSQIRKIVREQEAGTTFHTICSDDSKVYDPTGANHDESKGREYYYRRGVAGSARIGKLYKCKDENELRDMMAMPEEDLPKAARRTDKKHRQGTWSAVVNDKGRKGFHNETTGKTHWAKK